MKNVDFKVGVDTSPDAEWIKTATIENLEHQVQLNKITGQSDRLQPSADGENGIAKSEQGGLYSWTQTEEEIEIIVPLGKGSDGKSLSPSEIKTAGIKVKYFPRKVTVSFKAKEILCLSLYDCIDPDGCTWTLDSSNDESSLVITCEKSDGMSWPRITA